MKRSNAMIIALLVSIVLHIIVVYGLGSSFYQLLQPSDSVHSRKRPMKVVKLNRKIQEQPKPKQSEDKGQIVELPESVQKEKPKEADYLAEEDHRVNEETASKNYSINPEVVASEYSEKSAVQYEDAIDVDATENSTGAQVGNLKNKPNQQGKLFSNPSPFAKTNKEGLKKPTLASSTIQSLSGSPSNDMLNETKADRTQLNAHAYKYASYMNQIRRLVNFYWQQELDNLNSPLSQEQYHTVVAVEITAAGVLSSIVVTKSSSSNPVDACVTKAFHHAGPFPEPPELLVVNGVVQLPDFGFTLNVSGGHIKYGGVDPRAGVRFPGILKAPY